MRRKSENNSNYRNQGDGWNSNRMGPEQSFRGETMRGEGWSSGVRGETQNRGGRFGSNSNFDRVNRNGREDQSFSSDYGDYGDYNSFDTDRFASGYGSSFGPDRSSSDRFGSDRYDRSDRFASDRSGFYGKGPKGWTRSPERLKDEVCEALWRNPRVDASEIDVSIEGNTIRLTGTVESREAKREAENCIENLVGVEDIRNELRVQRSSEAGAGSSTLTGSSSKDRDTNRTANLS